MSNSNSTLPTFDVPSLQQLQREMEREAKRRAAKDRLIPFTEFTNARYETANLHRQIAEQLERVERGEVDRLMLMCPPRHGKSELASRRFPAWYLGRHPERSVISASANFSLAEEHGRDVRNLVRSQEYAEVFPGVQLAEDAQAKGRWNTNEGGSFYAVGVGGSLYGRGGHVIVIDDPFASMADARSETKRRELHAWFSGTLYNRLEKGGAIVIIAHRTHQADLQGFLRDQEAAGGDKWTVVELKALSDTNEALWPEKYDLAALERIRQNTTSHDWAALYLQQPFAEEGAYFRDEWIVPTNDDLYAMRSRFRCYGGSDFAVTAGGGDYTVHVIIGLDSRNRMYLLDMWRRQTTTADWIEGMCNLLQKWQPVAFWGLERTQITSAVGPFLRARMRERQVHTSLEEFSVVGRDKPTRCQSIRGRMELHGGLHVPARASWLADLKAELIAFPDGRHDDVPDALGLASQTMDRWARGPQMFDNVVKFRGPRDFKDYRPPSETLEDASRDMTVKML
jgi:predicted phage terminase large subunit-like protein